VSTAGRVARTEVAHTSVPGRGLADVGAEVVLVRGLVLVIVDVLLLLDLSNYAIIRSICVSHCCNTLIYFFQI